MEPKINAQTEKKTSRGQKSNSSDDGRGVENFGESGAVLGIRQPNRFTARNSSRSDSSRSSRPHEGKIYLGKILKRVEFLEQQFLEYAHSHQTRLETRLGESKQKEKAFLEVAQELKEELLTALAQEENEQSEEQLTEES
jgi:hypothetical protein